MNFDRGCADGAQPAPGQREDLLLVLRFLVGHTFGATHLDQCPRIPCQKTPNCFRTGPPERPCSASSISRCPILMF
jgi:hypothetical protein